MPNYTALCYTYTGTIDWRTEGLKFRKNEVRINVIETVTLTVSTTGQILRAEILGKVMMNTQLTGMYKIKGVYVGVCIRSIYILLTRHVYIHDLLTYVLHYSYAYIHKCDIFLYCTPMSRVYV